MDGILIVPNTVADVYFDPNEEPEGFTTLLQAFQFCDPKGTGKISRDPRFEKTLRQLASSEGLKDHEFSDFVKGTGEHMKFPEFVDWARRNSIKLPMGLPETLQRSDSTTSSFFPLPPTWTGPKKDAAWNLRTPIDDDLLLAELQDLINVSYRKIWTRDRKATGINKVPSEYRLERALRSENYKDWCDYYMKRHRVQSVSTQEGFVQFEVKTSEAKRVCARHQLEDQNHYGCNEWLLFHGTSRDAAEAICSAGFTMARAGSNTGSLYGKGTYFAESITKADEYARENADGVCCALVCRVVGGRVLYNNEATPDASKLQEVVMSRAYDTLLGDRETTRNTFREFVVFDVDQVYVEYVLFYRRIFDEGLEPKRIDSRADSLAGAADSAVTPHISDVAPKIDPAAGKTS